MKFVELEQCIALCRTICTMLKCDMEYVRTRILGASYLIEYKNCDIIISDNTTMANKILTVICMNQSTKEWFTLFNYKKLPSSLDKSNIQRPSKERIFNLNLQTDLPFTFEDMEKLEELMDELKFKVKVEVNIRGKI